MTATETKTYARPQVIRLLHMPLLFGIMDRMRLDDLAASRIAGIGSDARIRPGSLLKVMCARYLSGMMPGGIGHIQEFAGTLPAVFLGKELSEEPNPYAFVNRHAVAALLDGIAEYGATRFASEITCSVIDAESVKVAYLDSTACHVIGSPGCIADDASGEDPAHDVEDLPEISNKPLSRARNRSHCDRANLAKACQIGISARTDGIDKEVLLCQATFDEDTNDVTGFQMLCADGELERLKKNCPNLRALVGDSAMLSAASISACHKLGIEVVTKLRDSRVRREFADVNSGKIRLSSFETSCSGSETRDARTQKIRYAWLPPAVIRTADKSEVSVRRVLFVAEDAREKKAADLRLKAEKELEEVRSALKSLQDSPRECMADAVRDFKAITAGLKLVFVDDPAYEEILSGANAGRAGALAEKKVTAVKVFANASISEEALNAAVNSALYYVVATTNTDLQQDRETARALHEAYHGRSQNETQWRDINAMGTFFDPLFLNSPERTGALLAVVNIALLAGRILMTSVRRVLKKHSLSIAMHNMPVSQRPTLETFIRFAASEREATDLMVSPDFVSMPETISDSVLYLVAMDIGEQALRLYGEEFYDEERRYIHDSLRANRMRARAKTESAMF